MWIDVGVLYACVMRATEEEHAWLAEYLSFPDARYRKQGGKIRMLGVDGKFPAGLVTLVRKKAPGAGFQVSIADSTKPVPHDPAADLEWLRPYQLDALLLALEKRRGLIWLPTGSGKGEIVTGAVRAVPTEWLFLVHSKSLVNDMADRLEERNRQHGTNLSEGMPESALVYDSAARLGGYGRLINAAGRICEGGWTEGRRATFATYQSIDAAMRRGDPRAEALLRRVGGILCDEAHTVGADSFWRIVMSTTNACYRIGLSGTPLARSDRRSALVVAALGPVIYRQRAQPLISAGRLAKPVIRMLTVKQTTRRNTWQGVYGELVARSAKRNGALVAIAKLAQKPAFLFVKEVSHGKLLERALINAGISAQFIWGKHSVDWRKSALKGLIAGRTDVVVCSVVFQEGIDVEELRAVINAASGRSVIAAIQRVGRGMRVERDTAGNVLKDEFEVWDIMDEGQEWLARASRERKAAYIAEGYNTTVTNGAALGIGI